ncbi:MAG TPA: glycine cleavage T C-terminal barrel domain-containing protein [Pirellulales bacterium]|nr:glycine cleavage T C-terminal barrel domain-containing protein [Pirellulales bacterium]
MSSLEADYAALSQTGGLVDVSDRTQIELTGADRAAFLHNLTTNDLRKLPSGRGCEAFFLDARGHILALAPIFVGNESHVIETVPGQGSRLAAHLDRYLIREKVEIHDRAGQWGELFLGGANSPAVLQKLLDVAPPLEALSHVETQLGGCRVAVRRVDFTLDGGFLIACGAEDAKVVAATLVEGGAVVCGHEAFESARIEACTPWYGKDVTEKNLPQEVARDKRAISFTKGCYIGQETVARLDALGHVNKLLVGLHFAGPDVPQDGCELSVDSQVVGQVTSAAWSPRFARPVALGYVRRDHATPGTRFTTSVGEAEVAAP